MRELNLFGAGDLRWVERPEPGVGSPRGAVVRPFVVSRCDGDTLPIHRRVSRVMQAGLLDPAVGHICGPVPFAGPFAIGHECIAEVVEVGTEVRQVRVGDRVVVPWAVSCGECASCVRGLTSKCVTARTTPEGVRTLAAYGFGPSSGPFGGMVSDLLAVPFAEAMLVPVPPGVDPVRVAAASDNLSDGWRAVAPLLAERPHSRVLVLGGGGKSIGLYAAGIAAALGAAQVDYADWSAGRLQIAQALGAAPLERDRRSAAGLGEYDVVVEASSSTSGVRAAIRSTAPGGTCTAVGYYVGRNTGIPLFHMYATDITLRLGVSHPRGVLPELLEWVGTSGFAAERVTTEVADFDDAATAYAHCTTKLVLQREPLGVA
ncbi:alcohol dehydrogenase catalytic domain-containing protein [Phycicoccus endophyticus]|uniref:Alcohol dehydrogenase catalytic domain-containing protein n=1 Tax=Phycicoccus endophyticus TaxID=1690220 RepID=A0A7G9QZR4_9MICO|nr:alcohol dehydrogenase catalytic domain-containing protein [Phycicoccus endophyticus]NHI20034.1 alcohol dehydrogenase catalytic domain-containing protein [Phycicoccus endophyticus]QNN48839.1 alcohol dehydrogenase catalytic domain-containing protein [Phycicoccus endophyticus]GGL42415.1 glutathione-dependent formaldehyde dehydrogenase [Phycicoccus endophyticus]